MDSPVIQSLTSKSSAKEEFESSSKCTRELGMQLPQSPLGSLTMVVVSPLPSAMGKIRRTELILTGPLDGLSWKLGGNPYSSPFLSGLLFGAI
ncbi:hypothetical protein JCGZ_14748 [Jatropha curcas]|uniref:Uncharacterized protein n=1 Tax=Jatropha curcas TaxID=180498 RepID=A0A067K9B2_JATCU|nr:hypothetical protein JCGZ_14748 [Jatropha curcas]